MLFSLICRNVVWVCVVTVVLFGNVKAQSNAGDARLVRGQVISIARAPFTVQLRNPSNFVSCGGSLVTTLHVITAAHCVENVSPDDVTVVGGATRSDEDGTRRSVETITIHPDFSSETGDCDVAVLKLHQHLKGANIQTIPLCSKYLENFDFVQVFGWGWTENQAMVTKELRTISIPVMSQDYCVEQYKNYRMQITENMMCAAVPGILDSCTGDSGGPAVYDKQLCGIVSWGNGCGSAGWPGVYTRIDKVRQFIEKCIET